MAREREDINREVLQYRERTYSRLKVLYSQLKPVSTSILHLSPSNATLQASHCNDQDMIAKKDLITKRMTKLENNLVNIIKEAEARAELVIGRVRTVVDQWTRELQSAGNVRYVVGREEAGWYRSCVELVMSRFLPSDFKVCRVYVQMIMFFLLSSSLLAHSLLFH